MSKHILSSCTTLPLCITLHSIPSCENVITPFCENVITGSNLNRNKDPHECSTSPRSNKTGHKQTDYFLFCCDPLHVIFQLTWKNESKVAVVTWRAGNTRAISSETRSRWTSLFLLLWDLAGIPARAWRKALFDFGSGSGRVMVKSPGSGSGSGRVSGIDIKTAREYIWHSHRHWKFNMADENQPLKVKVK